MCKRIDSIFPFFDSRTQVLTYLYVRTILPLGLKIVHCCGYPQES